MYRDLDCNGPGLRKLDRHDLGGMNIRRRGQSLISFPQHVGEMYSPSSVAQAG